jgi:predicted GNAT family N-acyltransferase
MTFKNEEILGDSSPGGSPKYQSLLGFTSLEQPQGIQILRRKPLQLRALSTMTTHSYRFEMLAPPGNIVAPNGFPANPRPKEAPRLFLDAMNVRIKVFCDEQNCALEPELDEDDPRSWHWVAYSENNEPVSVIRIVPPPHGPHPNGYQDAEEETYVKLGRVATMPNHRGKGLSRKLTNEAFSWLSTHSEEVADGWKGLVLCHAQIDVEKMYGKLGFVSDAKLGKWDEEGIEHVGMWKRVQILESADGDPLL